MLELVEKQPDRTFFGASQGDGFAWCECDKCKALDGVPGVEMTDRLLDYVMNTQPDPHHSADCAAQRRALAQRNIDEGHRP